MLERQMYEKALKTLQKEYEREFNQEKEFIKMETKLEYARGKADIAKEIKESGMTGLEAQREYTSRVTELRENLDKSFNEKLKEVGDKLDEKFKLDQDKLQDKFLPKDRDLKLPGAEGREGLVTSIADKLKEASALREGALAVARPSLSDSLNAPQLGAQALTLGK